MNIARAAVFAAFVMVPTAAPAASAQNLLDGLAACAAIAANGERLACYDALGAQLKAAPPAPGETAAAALPPVAATPLAAAPATAAPPAATADAGAPSGIDRSLGVGPHDQTKPQQFGGENLTPPPPPPGQQQDPRNAMPVTIDSISAGVTRYSVNPFGQFTVVLDNGQTWKQLESDTGDAHFRKSGNSVVISRGLLNSYNMTINHASMAFKVVRVK